MGLSYKEVEARVSALANRSSYDREFIFDLLLAYGRSPSNVSRLRSGAASSLNAASDPATEVGQKNVLYLKEVPRGSEDELIAAIEKFSVDPVVVRLSARFVIVTDYRITNSGTGHRRLRLPHWDQHSNPNRASPQSIAPHRSSGSWHPAATTRPDPLPLLIGWSWH